MPKQKYKLAVFATPQFAISSLEALNNSDLFSLSLIITQPDKPSGRKLKLTPPVTKQFAIDNNIPCLQPESLKNITLSKNKTLGRLKLEGGELADFLNSEQQLDALLCIAYGKIIPPALIFYNSCGIVNLHPSLLPRWRGAAPIQHTIFAGDKRTGVCLMQIAKELDSGAVFKTQELPINPEENAGELAQRLAELGAQMLVNHLPEIISGNLLPKEQEDSSATYAQKWTSRECTIDWKESAEKIVRRIRASAPEPGARFILGGKLIKVFSAKQIEVDKNEHSPASVIAVNKKELVIAAGDSTALSINELQPAGKNKLQISEFLNGHKLSLGDKLE